MAVKALPGLSLSGKCLSEDRQVIHLLFSGHGTVPWVSVEAPSLYFSRITKRKRRSR